ncbi:MAG TPA: GntR family transcriptional regulator [Solirubrobacteraceae bacterium]|nr:GntR family transcriptional regulator [Solirubrobacteraceae bacterium]
MSSSRSRAARHQPRYGLRLLEENDQLRPPRPPSLAEHVCRVIRDDILTGRLPAGARLTEAMVMERTGVSRTPVREGLRTLEGEGLVITYRSRGTFVTYRLTPQEAELIYDVRLVLEPHLTGLAAARITPEALAQVEHVLARFVDALDAADPREAGQLDADFHLAIYEASASELMSVLRGYWSRLQLELSERVYTTEVPRRFLDEHLSVFDALRAGDAERASARMRAHIEHGRAAIVKALRG